MRSLFGRIKTKVGLMYVIIFLTLVVLGLSYGAFKIMSDNYKSSESLISNLMYGIEINSSGSIRPVISISECAKVKSGIGTPESPYEIDENSCN